MLVGFRCKNFRSIRDEQRLSMLEGPTKNLDNQVCDVSGFPILKSAVIFGANGAGKSNFFKAIRFSSKVIVKNYPEYGPHDTFLTLAGSESEPSMFEYEIEIKGQFFRYGYEMILKTREVVGEWLYEFYPGSDDRLIFLRKKVRGGDENDDTVQFEGKEEKFENINGELFLHSAKRKDFYEGKSRDRQCMHAVRQWFWESLAVIGPDASLLWDVNFGDQEAIDGLTDVVMRFDTGITGSCFCTYGLGDEPIDYPNNSRVRRDDLVTKGNYGFFRQTGDGKIEAFRFKHGQDGEFYVNLNEESDGTLRIMRLSPIIFRDDADCTYIVDEFDRALHPQVVYKFVEWFLKKKYKHNKQLIITTHNSHLLDQDLLRRDEIWFVNKDNEGATSLTSLDDYKIRFDKKVEKAYFERQFGGIPYIILPEDEDDAL